MDRDNRKSHLAPQISPATQDLLRSSAGDSPTWTTQTDHTLETPTSGEIPILGAVASPRDQHGSTSSRSPTRGGPGSAAPGTGAGGRPAWQSSQPGLGNRSATSSSIPKHSQQLLPPLATGEHTIPGAAIKGPQSANSNTSYALPLRPAPPTGPLPPPPPGKRRPGGDEAKKENRRQATFGPPSAGSYGV